MKEPVWLAEAHRWIGQREIPGPTHNAMVLKFWGLIRAPFKDDETPWCAGFVGGVLETCGIRSTRSAAALSYLTYGQPLNAPLPGAIAVKRRQGGGHVTFVVASDGAAGLWCLGGNQNDMVRLSLYPRTVFAAFRWPPNTPINFTPLPVMKAKGAAPKES